MPDNNEREQIREENLNWLLELHNNELNTQKTEPAKSPASIGGMH